MSTPENNGRQDASNKELEKDMSKVLGLWSDDQHALVEEAAKGASEADYETALRTFTGLAKRRRSLMPLRLLAGILAAASLLFAIGYFAWPSETTNIPPVLLGSDEIEIVSPNGVVESYNLFSWKTEDEMARRFGLRVWNEGELEAVLRVDGLERPEYAPTDKQRASLGKHITWQVIIQNEEGRALGIQSASASLRTP